MPIDKNILFRLFRPLSPVYAGIMSLREKLYQLSIFETCKFDVPVISVGNLTMGGTGKTPLVLYLAKSFLKDGLKPAVISRGYRGKATGKVNIVSDGSDIFLTAEECGDEPRLIAENIPEIPVLTGKKRKYPCQYAANQFGCNVLILDDAFQHLNVERDLDIVLFNADTLSEPKHVFPGGELREGFKALIRCDAIVYTGVTKSSEKMVNDFTQNLENYSVSKKTFNCRLGKPLFFDLKTEKPDTFDSNAIKFLAFCGIGNPERFKDYLESNNIHIAYFKSYPDHHTYTQEDIEELEELSKQYGAQVFITTEKDKVKLGAYSFHRDIKYVIPEVVMDSDFDSFVRSRLNISK